MPSCTEPQKRFKIFIQFNKKTKNATQTSKCFRRALAHTQRIRKNILKVSSEVLQWETLLSLSRRAQAAAFCFTSRWMKILRSTGHSKNHWPHHKAEPVEVVEVNFWSKFKAPTASTVSTVSTVFGPEVNKADNLGTLHQWPARCLTLKHFTWMKYGWFRGSMD